MVCNTCLVGGYEMSKETVYVSDKINIIDVLEKGRIIVFKAGVGSGKTKFACEELPKYGRVLFITTLKTIIEEVNSTYMSKNLTAITIGGFSKGYVYEHEKDYVKMRVLNEDKLKAFDYIVVDEVHDLVMFEGFIDGVRDIKQLIMKTNKKSILMSACPEAMLFAYRLDKAFIAEELLSIKTDAVPGKFVLYPNSELLIAEAVKRCHSEKGIYYTKRIRRVKKLEAYFKEQGLKAVAIVGDKSPSGKMLMSEKGRSDAVIEFENGRFPEVDIVVTNAKLQQGINITDERVKFLFTEMMDQVSLNQISGRVRAGAEVMFGIAGVESDARSVTQHVDYISGVKPNVANLGDVYKSCTHGYLKRTITDGITHDSSSDIQKFSVYNSYDDKVEFNWELYTRELVIKASREMLMSNPVKYINDYIGIKSENIHIYNNDHIIDEIESMMTTYKGQSFIHGMEKQSRLKSIFRASTRELVLTSLATLGYEVTFKQEKRIEGKKVGPVYILD